MLQQTIFVSGVEGCYSAWIFLHPTGNATCSVNGVITRLQTLICSDGGHAEQEASVVVLLQTCAAFKGILFI